MMKYLLKKIELFLKYAIRNKLFISLICFFVSSKSLRLKLKQKIVYLRSISLEEKLDTLDFIPKIKSAYDTIDEIVLHRKSISRFGDGEFNLIKGNSIPFQKYSKRLQDRLKDILLTEENDFLVATNYFYFNSCNFMRDEVFKFYNTWTVSNLEKIISYFSSKNTYYDAGFTSPYVSFNDNYDHEKHYGNIKKIWHKKDIVLICGEGILSGLTHNIFQNSLSIDYQYAPKTNAFDEYEHILKKAKEIDKNKLVIIILGPTATVLAYDLFKLGYQALDLGHIAKDYEYFKKEVICKSENITRFLKPD